MKSLYYLEKFIKLSASADMLGRKLFPNLKEITESFAMFNAILKYKLADRNDENVVIIVVGDGHTPRTAALCAFLSKWSCISIDPLMRDKEWNIKRLITIDKKVEDLPDVYNYGADKKVIILMPHSHADINVVWSKFKGDSKRLISLPCCNDEQLHIPFVGYIDKHVHSPKNIIFVYGNT